MISTFAFETWVLANAADLQVILFFSPIHRTLAKDDKTQEERK